MSFERSAFDSKKYIPKDDGRTQKRTFVFPNKPHPFLDLTPENSHYTDLTDDQKRIRVHHKTGPDNEDKPKVTEHFINTKKHFEKSEHGHTRVFVDVADPSCTVSILVDKKKMMMNGEACKVKISRINRMFFGGDCAVPYPKKKSLFVNKPRENEKLAKNWVID